MIKRIHEKINIFIAKSPKKAVLIGIMLFNLVFALLASVLIFILSQNIEGISKYSFWGTVYYTVCMMLDPGFIESIIADIGKTGVVAVIVCLFVIFIGMVMLSGAVIGYITNVISDFIDSKNNGNNKLMISDHIVIINWNSRAVEIINEYLYKKKPVKIVVFVPDNRKEIDDEIRNRLDTTLIREAEQVYTQSENMPFFKRKQYIKKNLLEDNITYIVREGNIASATDLDDICIHKAKAVLILDNNNSNPEKGNTQTIKTLIQVSEISKGNDNQIILVEVADKLTENLVFEIINFKCKTGREKIIPVSYNRLLGQTYSQIAVMPQINDLYEKLFTNRKIRLLSQTVSGDYSNLNENEYIRSFLSHSCTSVPLAIIDTDTERKAYYFSSSKKHGNDDAQTYTAQSCVKLNETPSLNKRNVIILGHNSNMDSILKGFDSYQKEGAAVHGSAPLNIMIIDEEVYLSEHDYYREYNGIEVIASDVFDENVINKKISDFYEHSSEYTTVLILSDDSVENEDIDASAITYLIYVQKELQKYEATDTDCKRKKLEVVVEILNPKNEGIVKNYGADRVIISNRYLSHIISQLCTNEAIYDFYSNILTCETDNLNNSEKSIYVKNVADFFTKIPGKCTAYDLIRAVFESGSEDRKAIVLGYIRDNKDYIFFDGNQKETEVILQSNDSLILFGKM